ncbi:helix-turn-helix domain-containing protein [Actinomadura kijaniata]|uniref:PucR family transcriptional regulator n=1 Tax=Actinomadura kijaniata TaxID=46161 RepID=UPI000836AA39|nr:PucR family transcriptional regulator [Actinomadura kijaniata]
MSQTRLSQTRSPSPPPSRALDRAGPDPAPVPARLADLMRAQLPEVVADVVAEIRRTIPEYDRPENSTYDQVLRLAAETLTASFVEKIADPAASSAERDETCRSLGHFEAVEGRSLDHLQAAYRTAFHVAWRHTVTVAEREEIPSGVVASVVEAMLLYVDDAIALARAGHRQAQEHADMRRREQRTELLRLLLRRPPVAVGALEEPARAAGWWPLPVEATMVAVHPDAPCTRSALDSDVLTDLDAAEPCLLVPGPLTEARRTMLRSALADASSVMGLTVPLERAAHSLRWARRTLALAEEGVIRDGSLVPCEEHLVTMWLLSDVPLVEELARRHLAPLEDLSDGARRKLTETLAAWVTTRGTAIEIGERLNVHAQTVRYRLRQLEAHLGDALEDADARFSLEATLRAATLNRRRALGRRGTPGS